MALRGRHGVLACPNVSAPPQDHRRPGCVATLAVSQGTRIADIKSRYQYLGAGFLGGKWPNQDNAVAARNTGSPDFFTGSLSDVAVFDRPLTGDLVTELYAARTPRKLLSQITQPSGVVTAKIQYNRVTGRVEQVTDADNGVWKLGDQKIMGSSQVYASAVLGGAPADYWRLNDLPGSAEPYNEVNGIEAGYSGAVLGGTAGIDGPFRDTVAPRFTAGGDTAVTAADPSVDTAGSFTVSTWVNLTDTAASRQAVSVAGARATAFGLGYDRTANRWAATMCAADTDTASCPKLASTVAPTTDWTHLAATFDAPTKTARIYVNGAPQGSLAMNITPWTASGPLLLGLGRAVGTDADPWTGRIAEVATFRYRLSDQQIKAQFDAADRSTTGPTAVPMPARSVSVVDPANKVSSEVFNLYTGQQISSIDTLGNLTQFGYDATTGAMRLRVDPNGNKTELAHDVRGNVIEQSTWQDQTDESTKSTVRMTYFPNASTVDPAPDPRNDKLLTVRDPRTDGTYVTSYTYDTGGNVTSVTDPLGRVSTTTLSDGSSGVPAGLVTREVLPGGGVKTVSYRPNGDVAQIVDPAGLTVGFTYDRLGRVLTRTEITSAAPEGRTETLTYDKAGRVRTVTEPGVLNRVTGAVHTAVTTYVYDDDGRITSTSTADTTGGDATRTATARYNTLGQLVSETDAAGNVTTYTYDVYGEVDSVTDAAGTKVVTERDSEGQALSVKVKNFTGDPDDPSPAQDVRTEFRQYDPAGRLIRTTDVMNWETRFEYTHNNLLTKVTRADGDKLFVVEQNTYNKAGNLTRQVTNDGRTVTTYTVDAAGRPYESTMDPDGAKRTVTAVLSPDDNVVSTTVRDAAGTTVGYREAAYDPAGREVATTEYTTSRSAPVARWKLDENEGTTAADAAGNSAARLSDSGVQWSTDSPPSRPDLHGSVSLAGGRLATTGPAVDTTRSFTVSAWVRMDEAQSNQIAVSQDGTRYPAFGLGYDSEANAWQMSMCAADRPECVAPLSQGHAALDTWTHLAGVYDADAKTINLYVNGVSQGSTSWCCTVNSAAPLSIGDVQWDAPGRTANWPGNIADVQIYQRALDAAEIGAGYQGTSSAADSKVIRTSYERDSDGSITSETDPNGNLTHYAYDEAGRLAVTIDPAVRAEVHGGAPVTSHAVTRAGYNTFGELTEEQDATGNVVTTRYDANGRPVATIHPTYRAPGSDEVLRPQDSVEYDNIGRVTRVTDALGDATSYTYDALDRLTRQTNPDGGTFRYGYSLAGDLTSATDPTGATETATYDHLGRRLTGTAIVRQTAAAHTTRYAYGPGGWLSQVTSPGGVQARLTYNAIGEVVTSTDAANATTSYRYDGLGRAVRTTLADNTYQTTSYDLAGRATAKRTYDASDTLLQTASARYDRTGNVTAVTDPKGTSTEFAYDATDQLTSQTEPISATDRIVSTFGYDAAGRLTRFTDGRGNAFGTTYNTWGAVESRIEPATAAHPDVADRTFTTVYDVAGQPVAQQQPGGVRLAYEYDEMGRLVRSSGTGAEAETKDRTYGYDRAGRVTSLSGTGGDNTLVWDDRGQLTSVSGPSGNSSFTYTADGQMKTRADAAGTTTYGYDTAGRLSTTANPTTGVQSSVAYDTLSRVSKVTYGNGGNTRGFGYDSLHRLQSDELKTPGGASVAKITYGYDANSNLTSKVTTGFAVSASNTYTYDLANRLTGWNNGTSTVEYQYDKSGNRTKAGDKSFTYDARNRLLASSDNKTYEYTARGTLRRTVSGTVGRETVADAFGQVVRQQGTDSGDNVDYEYDGLGRVIKSGFAYTGLGNDLAADGVAVYTRDPGGGLVGIQQGGSSVYAWTDRHTDVVAQFTATGTALAGSTTYDPLGKVVGSASTIGSLGFQQEYTEQSTGRVNMHARWYNPETGQFDTRDTAGLSPVGDSANANRYGYGNANPLSNIDPSGHSIMNDCGGPFTCVLKGFLDSFDVVDMAKTLIGALSDLGGSIRAFLDGVQADATRWTNKISEGLHNVIDCSDFWWIPYGETLCNKGIKGAAYIGGWACAISGVCDIAYDCFAEAGDRKGCALAVGGLLADAVKALVTMGAGAIGSKIASRVTSLLKRYSLPDKRKKKPGGGGGNKGQQPGKQKPGGGGKTTCKTKNCKKSPGKGNGKGKDKPNKNKPDKNKGKPKPGKKPGKPKPGKPGGSKPGGGKPGGSKPGGGNPRPDTNPGPQPDLDLPTARGNDGAGRGYDDSRHYDTEVGCPVPPPGSKAGGGHSFDPDTRVLMADGSSKAIKEVKVGDKVTATDPESGKTAAKPVTILHRNVDKEFADVTVDTKRPAAGKKPTGEGHGGRSTRGPTQAVLHTTQNHPFWDASTRTWVNAADLQPGRSALRAPNGDLQHVAAVRTSTSTKQMHDLTIADIHTYYVLAGKTPVLVHNNNGGCVTGGSQASAPRPGLAQLNYYPGVGRSGHFSIEVTNGDAVKHMHLMPHDGTAMVSDVKPGSLPAPAMSHTFELPDADAAMEHMLGQLGNQGDYNPLSNSCLTFCTKTLQKGGVDAPVDKAAIPWARKILGG
jgi:RHS repeat-associated protein